ncbi:MAG: uracil-DNA glycosylase, partial [Gemmatimonadota bacterium]|nr:uracil-DNA glycosylase [Gemmatimonadota bacterium]
MIQEDVIRCRRCPRLVEWRERVAVEKRRALSEEEYWG